MKEEREREMEGGRERKWREGGRERRERGGHMSVYYGILS